MGGQIRQRALLPLVVKPFGSTLSLRLSGRSIGTGTSGEAKKTSETGSAESAACQSPIICTWPAVAWIREFGCQIQRWRWINCAAASPYSKHSLWQHHRRVLMRDITIQWIIATLQCMILHVFNNPRPKIGCFFRELCPKILPKNIHF